MAAVRGSGPIERFTNLKETSNPYDIECIRLNNELIAWNNETVVYTKRPGGRFTSFVSRERLMKLAPTFTRKVEEYYKIQEKPVPDKIAVFILGNLWEINTEKIASDISTIQFLKQYKAGSTDEEMLYRLSNCKFYTPQPSWLEVELKQAKEELTKRKAQEKVAMSLKEWLESVRARGYAITDEERQLLESAGIIVTSKEEQETKKK